METDLYKKIGNLKLRPEPKNRNHNYDNTNRQPPKYVWQDEKTGEIKERLLSSAAASAASASLSEVQMIHDFIFGY